MKSKKKLQKKLDSYDILFFLSVDWNSVGVKNRQHFLVIELAKQLSKSSKILCIEPGKVLFPNGFYKNLKQLFNPKITQIESNLFLLSPIVLIHESLGSILSFINFINRLFLKFYIKRAFKKHCFRNDNLISWICNSFQDKKINLVKEKLLIYDCFDYGESLNFIFNKIIKNKEMYILNKADIVFTVSDEIKKKISPNCSSLYLLPNAVEFQKFNLSKKVFHEKIDAIKTPKIAFIGKISLRLDYKLLYFLAKNNSNWNFVFIGLKENEKELLRNKNYCLLEKCKNAHFLGAFPFEEVPSLMSNCDIFILPYTNSLFNMCCSPLKLYDYLATGKPIISTNLPFVKKFTSMIYVASDYKNFEAYINKAIIENDLLLTKNRINMAYQNSWSKRASQALEIIDSHLN